MWQVLYVRINPGVNSSFLMAPTSYFSSVCKLVTRQDLGNAYLGCSMHPQHILIPVYPTIFVGCDLFLLG